MVLGGNWRSERQQKRLILFDKSGVLAYNTLMNENMKLLIQSAGRTPDPRCQTRNFRHKLCDILVIAFCAIICGAESYADLELFGKFRQLWLSMYLELPNGIPNADTFQRVFEIVDSAAVAKALRKILTPEDFVARVVAFDGKTQRSSKKGKRRAWHTLSAYLTDAQIVLGEVICDEKSNEITAIPELLDTLNVEKAIVTIDAMGAQTKIAEKIVEKKADYVLALKGNQADLFDDVRFYLDNEQVPRLEIYDPKQRHGRQEKREYFLETNIDWLHNRENWAGLSAIGAVKSTVTEKGETRIETRYFLTSLISLEDFARAVRAHWGIENKLHWHLDVTFNEDASRVRNRNATQVWNILRKTALEHLKSLNNKKYSLKALRKGCGWSNDLLLHTLFGNEMPAQF